MWERWWETMKRQWAGSGGASAEDEDPEALLERAQEEMRALHAKNRERAVRAITQKNQLQAMTEEAERVVRGLREAETRAREDGDPLSAVRLREEAEAREQELAQLRDRLSEAEEAAGAIKAAIKREEAAIRRRTAHALALRAQWHLVKVERSITLSLAQISTGAENRLTREQARERHERNREYVAEAFTHRNELQQMVDGIAVQVAGLRERAEAARRAGDDAAENEVLREMEQYEATLAQANEALRHAEGVTERARALVEEESARVRALAEVRVPSPPAELLTPAPRTVRQKVASGGEDTGLMVFLLVLTGLTLIAVAALLWWLLGGAG